MTITKTEVSSIAEAVAVYGEADVLEVINQALRNRKYRQEYQKDRNKEMRKGYAIYKQAQKDPQLAEKFGLGTRS